MSSFAIDELIAALTAAQSNETERPEGAFTAAELTEMLPDRSIHWIQGSIRRGFRAGLLECIRVPYVRVDGVRVQVPAYRLRKD